MIFAALDASLDDTPHLLDSFLDVGICVLEIEHLEELNIVEPCIGLMASVFDQGLHRRRQNLLALEFETGKVCNLKQGVNHFVFGSFFSRLFLGCLHRLQPCLDQFHKPLRFLLKTCFRVSGDVKQLKKSQFQNERKILQLLLTNCRLDNF